MLRQTLLLLLAWPLALALCLAACKTEPDLPGDPHVPLINPFTGVWKETETQYWQFRRDGTGGRAAAPAGPFPNEFNFLFFNGKGTQAAPPSLVLLEGSPVTVTCYKFSMVNNRVILSPSITLERVSGAPQVISLANPLIGEWSAQWLSGGEHGNYSTWSLKYYTDGTVKTYHHGVAHQFENAYALRGNTLVIFGAWRFSFAPVIAEINLQENGKWRVIETELDPEPTTNCTYAEWVYTKVAAAQWL